MTPAEETLWNALRDRRLSDAKFRRQVPFGNYIADFLCYRNKLIIEVDGGMHDIPEHQERGKERDAYFMSLGYRIIHIRNQDILKNLHQVLTQISHALKH